MNNLIKLSFIFPCLLSATTLKNDNKLNYFESSEENQVINNYEWYETPLFKKEITSTQNYESFATYDLAKETMINVLKNAELNYKVGDVKAHWYTSTYTDALGFASIFDGSNKYQTNFATSSNWITLESGKDKVQRLNVKGINDYTFGHDGTSYEVCIIPEYVLTTSVISKNVYVFVYKDVTNDVLNPNFETQVNSFIEKQAENIIVKRNIFGDSKTKRTPAPIFKDPEYVPTNNSVFSNLKKITSSDANEIKTSDGTYYNHAYFNEEEGLHTFNYPTSEKPSYSKINSREVWSLLDSNNEGNKYSHYICQESNLDKRKQDWKNLIVSESSKYPLFQNVLETIVDGSLTDYYIDINSEYFKDYQSGDIKLRFKTNDKTWIKVTIEHTDEPKKTEEHVFTSTCNWNLNEDSMISSNEFSFATFLLPLINGKYTFHSVSSLGDYNAFSFGIINAPEEKHDLVILDSSTKKPIDTWTINGDDMSQDYVNMDVALDDASFDLTKIKVKNATTNISITTSDIENNGSIIGKRIHVTPLKTIQDNDTASFTAYYPESSISKEFLFCINKVTSSDFSIIESIDFTSSGGKTSFDKTNGILTADNDVAFVVPASQYITKELGSQIVVYRISYTISIDGISKIYSEGEMVALGEGNYKATLTKTIEHGETNEAVTENKVFTIKINKAKTNIGGLPLGALIAIICVPCVIVVVLLIVIIKIRKGQSLKKEK